MPSEVPTLRHAEPIHTKAEQNNTGINTEDTPEHNDIGNSSYWSSNNSSNNQGPENKIGIINIRSTASLKDRTLTYKFEMPKKTSLWYAVNIPLTP